MEHMNLLTTNQKAMSTPSSYQCRQYVARSALSAGTSGRARWMLPPVVPAKSLREKEKFRWTEATIG